MIIGVLVYILSVMNLFPNCLPDRDIRENILKVHEILYALKNHSKKDTWR